MSTKSSIEWTETTWNPVTGCTKISPGCANCYAERMAKRLKAMGQPNYRNGFVPTVHEHLVDRPLRWKKPQVIFVNSMSDLFHEDVPFEFISRVFETMCVARQHIFQVLTKRSERLLELAPRLPWPDNVWMGVSVENNDYMFRVGHLEETLATVKFISFEPLIGPISDRIEGVDWAIVGGESGPGARPLHKHWVLDILHQCREQKTPFFFKQWGGVRKKAAGRELDGRTDDEMPKPPQPTATPIFAAS